MKFIEAEKSRRLRLKLASAALKTRVAFLQDEKLIERVGAQRFILSRHLYSSAGKPGAYTRRRGLDRSESKELLVRHIRDNDISGSQLAQLCQVLTQKSPDQIKKLMQELKREDRIHFVGVKGKGHWHFGSPESAKTPTPPAPKPKNSTSLFDDLAQ